MPYFRLQVVRRSLQSISREQQDLETGGFGMHN